MNSRLSSRILCEVILLLAIGSFECFSCLRAETVVLRTGKTLQGTIILQDSLVVLIQDKDGRRFQYPLSEIESIGEESMEVASSQSVDAQRVVLSHPVAIRLSVQGGLSCLRQTSPASGMEASFQLGTRNLSNRGIFLGGSVGYLGSYHSDKKHFIPLEAVVHVPLSLRRHAPELGFTMGYGVGVHNKGGMTTSFSVGWRFQYRPQSALTVGVQARFQQGEYATYQMVDGKAFSYTAEGVYIHPTLFLGWQF